MKKDEIGEELRNAYYRYSNSMHYHGKCLQTTQTFLSFANIAEKYGTTALEVTKAL